MLNKKNMTSFSTGMLITLSLGHQNLHAIENTESTPKTIAVEKKIPHDHSDHNHMESKQSGGMRMDMEGMVMYENKDRLPKDCPEISEDITIEVKSGIQYAEQFPGTVFGFDQHQWQAKPCARITVKFTNDDDIRHQWMIHGLPKYLYPEGMFHMEINGIGTKTGTFIVPNSHYTYLVHCDIAQHMEKGMKAQLKVGNGRGNLPSIPGISDPTIFGRLSKN